MGSCSSWSCNYWVWKVVLVGVCWLLLVGLMVQSSSVRGSTISTSSSRRRAVLMGRTSPRHDEEVVRGNKGKQKELVFNPELDLNYMVRKRRVPNGPDPIHNRKLPPGQA
ncbi:hypothetical protein HS088_TW06G00831 [Tripterygium wilfordii]|uniref:CLAVATA3/ESR (CLE)-related protein 25 n=1 Tax=Tripterygium wilfordii TaxID=458696 RepID=A0A7J7DK51_TRIWF|nr:uncharacterized protein LOC120001064 [Tripterygium wilfordii]KAF5746659.1 hypothetical protein HS088_TW06G00831 [Tripterygium wilfordii]